MKEKMIPSKDHARRKRGVSKGAEIGYQTEKIEKKSPSRDTQTG